jgi:hypothetical protein
MKRFALIAALALAACSPAPDEPTAPAEATAEPAPAPADAPSPAITFDVLTPDGIGPLKIGMSQADVIAAVGDTRTLDAADLPGECREFQPLRAPDGLWVMIESGRLTRISLAEMSTLKTDKGLGLGDAADAVKTAYGPEAKASPHKYQDAPAEYVTWWRGGPRAGQYMQDGTARGIVYEIDGTGKVGAIHAGGPSIQYVEGCA